MVKTEEKSVFPEEMLNTVAFQVGRGMSVCKYLQVCTQENIVW